MTEAMTKPNAARKRVTTVPPSTMDDADEISPGVFEVPDEAEGTRIEERAPRIPTPTVSEQVEALRTRVKSTTDRLRTRAERLGAPPRKTVAKRPRTSVEGLISAVWSIGSRVVASVPNAWPVANVLAMQSPVAGKILEDTVKNTAVDTILQPFARLANGGQVATALLGPPILVAVACARPETQPVVEPLLREALKSWLVVAGPKMIERAKEEKQFQEEYGQTIEEMIRVIFTPPEGFIPDDVHNGPNGVPA